MGLGGRDRQRVAQNLVLDIERDLKEAKGALYESGLRLEEAAAALERVSDLAKTTAHMLKTGERHL